MPARSTPRSITTSDESLVPHLSAAAKLLDDCATAFSTALVQVPELLICEDVREVSLTLAALERVLAAFAGAALAVIAPSLANTQRQDGLLSLVSELESFPDKTWKRLPSGGIATLLCQTVDSCEVVVEAMRELITAGKGIDSWWRRRSARLKLRVAGAQLAVTLRLVVISTATAGALEQTEETSTFDGSVHLPLPVTPRGLSMETNTPANSPIIPLLTSPPSNSAVPLRRSRSFTLLTSNSTPTSLLTRKSIARRLLETTLLPRAAVVWPTLSKEADNVLVGIERLHAAAFHADPWRLSPSPLVQLFELPILVLFYIFYTLAPRAWASEVFDNLVASPQPQLMLHLWRLSSMPLLRAASWALRAAPVIEKRTVIIAGVRTTILSRRGRGLDATMLSDASVAPLDVWPHARDWVEEGGEGLTLESPGAEARTPSRLLPPVILWLHGGGFIAEEVGFEGEKRGNINCLIHPTIALSVP